MSIEQKDVYAALGMDAPAEKPEAADPAAQNGENEPALTEPAGQDKQQTGGSTAADPAGEGRQIAGAADSEGRQITAARDAEGRQITGAADANDSEKEMPREERARQAQLRRQRQQDEAVQAAVRAERERLQAQHAKDLEEIFSKAGMTDRYDGNKPIKSMEEFRAWNSKAQAAGLSRRLQEGKLTAEDFQAAVDNSPAVKAARAAVERLDAREQEQARQRYEQEVAQELAEIHELDPGINSLRDILDRETGQEFSRLVTENHLTFTQAFRLANADQLAKAQAMTVAEGTARQQNSKSHMRGTASTGGMTVDVPRNTVAAYRALDPKMTMEEIRQDYAKRMGKMR